MNEDKCIIKMNNERITIETTGRLDIQAGEKLLTQYEV